MSNFSLNLLLLPIFFNSATCQTLVPVDESDRDPQLKTYLNQLRTAVQKRDGQALQELIASDILLTFGPPSDKSPEETLELMNSNSSVWNQLEEILQFGGTFSGHYFCIPYVFSEFPDELNPHAHQVIIKPSVIARRKPDRRALKVATLEFAIVRTDIGTPEVITGTDGSAWIKIYLNNSTAYVLKGVLRSSLGARICLEKRQAGWIMTHFVSGD